MTKSIIGIVKVVEPSGNPVIGIGDSRGKFCWLATEDIIETHPKTSYGNKLFEKMQRTAFLLKDSAKVKIRDERNFEKYKDVYKNTEAIPQPIPRKFKPGLIDWDNPPEKSEPKKGKRAKKGEGMKTTNGLLRKILKELSAIREALKEGGDNKPEREYQPPAKSAEDDLFGDPYDESEDKRSSGTDLPDVFD